LDPCMHKTLDFLGEQRTDEGVNSYYKCRDCGATLVITPSRSAFALKDAPGRNPHASPGRQGES
jgi:hypothetical protein